MSKLFKPISLHEVEIGSRIVRSATYEGMANPDGTVTDDLIEVYSNLAAGGAGLIITGLTYVHPGGRGLKHMIGADSDDKIPGLKRLTDAVHAISDAKIALQIAHCGRQSLPSVLDDPVAPSALPDPVFGTKPRELTIEEIGEVISSFGASALRAKRSGFDAVQIHAAHGYLLSAFLSPYLNRRNDDYGGSPENRMRILMEVYDAVREQVGKYPVLVKLQVEDYLPGGLTLEESPVIAKSIAERGIDAIEISGGVNESMLHVKNAPACVGSINTKDKEAYFKEHAKEIRKYIGSTPLILVGGIKSPDVAESLLEDGVADMVSMSRALIREPDLPLKWKNGSTETAKCISCNTCLVKVASGKLKCYQERDK